MQCFTPGIPFIFLVPSPALCFHTIFLPFSLQPRGPVSLESERDGMPAVNNRGTYIVNKKFRFFSAFFRYLTANSLFLPWIIFFTFLGSFRVWDGGLSAQKNHRCIYLFFRGIDSDFTSLALTVQRLQPANTLVIILLSLFDPSDLSITCLHFHFYCSISTL